MGSSPIALTASCTPQWRGTRFLLGPCRVRFPGSSLRNWPTNAGSQRRFVPFSENRITLSARSLVLATSDRAVSLLWGTSRWKDGPTVTRLRGGSIPSPTAIAYALVRRCRRRPDRQWMSPVSSRTDEGRGRVTNTSGAGRRSDSKSDRVGFDSSTACRGQVPYAVVWCTGPMGESPVPVLHVLLWGRALRCQRRPSRFDSGHVLRSMSGGTSRPCSISCWMKRMKSSCACDRLNPFSETSYTQSSGPPRPALVRARFTR